MPTNSRQLDTSTRADSRNNSEERKMSPSQINPEKNSWSKVMKWDNLLPYPVQHTIELQTNNYNAIFRNQLQLIFPSSYLNQDPTLLQNLHGPAVWTKTQHETHNHSAIGYCHHLAMLCLMLLYLLFSQSQVVTFTFSNILSMHTFLLRNTSCF